MVGELLSELLVAVRKGHTPTKADISYALREARNIGGLNDSNEGTESDMNSSRDRLGTRFTDLGSVLSEVPSVLRRDICVKPRTRGQRRYLEAIKKYEVCLSIGPAGTGKTYLAMAAAVSALLNKQVNRLILTRPAVEAGETLGFLPGDLEQKVTPYLRPLYDALYSMLDIDRAQRLIENEQVEVAPLAFMRGRTLSHSFVILDEAQNTTSDQMKMFLTRIGEGSRAVVTGDITQIDLAKGTKSGLVEAKRILRNTDGVAIIHLDNTDVVRHPLVQDIVDAYEADTSSDEESAERDKA